MTHVYCLFQKKLPQVKSPENIQGNKEQKYLVFTFFKNTVQINLEGVNPEKKKRTCVLYYKKVF